MLALANDAAATENERAVALRKAAELDKREAAELTEREQATEKTIDSLCPRPESGSIVYRNLTKVDGLGMRVTAADVRAWVLDYVCEGKQRRYTIGKRYDKAGQLALALKDAIIKARRLHGSIAQDIDPFKVDADADAAAEAKADAERRANDPDENPTVGRLADLWFIYAEDHLRKNTVLTAHTAMNRLKEQGFDQRKVREVTRDHLKELKAALGKTPMLANRCRAFVSAIFNWGAKNGVGGLTEASVNPARRVKGVLEDYPARECELVIPSQKQIDALHAALDARAGQQSADAIRLLLLTGARKTEVLALEWQEIKDLDGDDPAWVLPADRAKQKKKRRFPLSDPQVLSLLRERHKQTGKGKYVFPGLKPNKPLLDIYHLWDTVRREAGLTFRLHALRHVFVSRGLKAGVPIFTVGKLVGHSSAWMTEQYSHLADRDAADAAKLIGSTLAPSAPANGANHVA